MSSSQPGNFSSCRSPLGLNGQSADISSHISEVLLISDGSVTLKDHNQDIKTLERSNIHTNFGATKRTTAMAMADADH
ncbi:hypothetical protein ASC97_15495 [Rhizobium sp. Root1203]|nr:hypothetical protein ASC97_15495 [Rhizobium sp. Root1203]